MGNRTGVQIQCPHIIENLPADLTTADEELGTDHRHGMEVTTAGSWTVDHDAGPLLRYWSTRNSDQLESVV
jgi:hypothetical protein